MERHRQLEERAEANALAAAHATALQLNLERGFSVSYAVAALVRQGHGTVPNFESVAREILAFYPNVAALELAPGGVVRRVVPLVGNESAVGHDLLRDPVRDREARLARDTGKLTLAGPFELRQGGVGAVARLPVFIDGKKGGKEFWGFVCVLMRFPEALDAARLYRLPKGGVGYQLWRVHPDTGQKQIIAASSPEPLEEPVQRSLALPNSTWTLSVAPLRGWGHPVAMSFMASTALLFSLLLAWLAKLLVESREHRAGLEALVAQRTAEIRESNERLRLLADNLPDSYIYQYNGNRRFLEVSAGVERLHGIKAEEVLADSGLLLRQVDPVQLLEFSGAEAASAEGMSDFEAELRITRPDGDSRWLQLRSRPRRRRHGSVVWDGVATDVTSRRETEEALRAERDFSDAVVNSLPSVFYMFDAELKFLRWNRKFEEVTGYSAEEISAMSPVDFFAGDERARVAATIEEVFAHGEGSVEANFVSKDGTSRSYYFTGIRSSICPGDCLLGVGMDIRERKRFEQELETARLTAVQQRHFLEAVMEALPVGVAIVDAEGRFIQMNHAFKKVWGGARPLHGAHGAYRMWWIGTRQPVHPDELASALALCSGETKVGQLLQIEKEDGTVAYVHNSAAPFRGGDGSIAGCAVAVMDITEQIETKESLRVAKEAAEAADSAKSQFLANMSHELRTPLAAILGLLHLALQEELPPAVRQYLDTSVNSSRALLRILNDILDMTNIVSGRLSFEEEPFELRQCLSEVLEIISFEAQQKGLPVVLSVDDALPRTVSGDQVRLRQVLLNLIGNAVKFTRSGKVEVRLTSRGRTAQGKSLVGFAVTDTGIGIPREKRELIFRAFTQVDASYSRSFGGSGLGLAISSEIVALLGGTIAFESEEGRGSTFFFTIPLTDVASAGAVIPAAEAPLPEPTPPVREGGKPPVLLVVEDDPVIRTSLAKILRMSHFEVAVAEDGQEAVEMWEREDFALILMDIQMPRLNGFDATRAIREKEGERGGHIPIVAVTAHALKEDRERCLAAGMDDYISKPIDIKKIVELVRKLLAASANAA